MTRVPLPALLLVVGCSAGAGGGGHDTGRSDGTPDAGIDTTAPDAATTGVDAARPPTIDAGLDECATLELEAESTLRPVDIVWVVDSSGSMDNEAARVQENMNRFATDILAAGIDPHVVVITDPDYVTVPPPLGTDPEHYRFVDRGVSSNAPLERLLSEWDRYADFLRPDAVTHFVAVTDDESDLNAAAFDAEMTARLGHEYTFHAIASEDTGGGRECAGAADVGYQYHALSRMTDGLEISICTSDWSGVFDELTRHVTETAPLPCDFVIPEPPEDETLDYDRVNVEYTPSTGDPYLIPSVGAESACAGRPRSTSARAAAPPSATTPRAASRSRWGARPCCSEPTSPALAGAVAQCAILAHTASRA